MVVGVRSYSYTADECEFVRTGRVAAGTTVPQVLAAGGACMSEANGLVAAEDGGPGVMMVCGLNMTDPIRLQIRDVINCEFANTSA